MTDYKKHIFPFINRPGRYIGEEYNSIIKDSSSLSVEFCLIFPDMYEIGMSHQGLQILYHILNQHDHIGAERCYCPDIDVERLLREKEYPLFSLENTKPLKEFDVLAFTLPYELCYTNILTILDLAGVPFFSSERDDSMPLILGGGSCSMNGEPLADFFDAILLGDGEEAVLEIAKCVQNSKENSGDKKSLLEDLSQIAGVYIPAHYDIKYLEDGKIKEIKHIGTSSSTVSRRIVENLDKIDHLFTPIVPNAKIVHDRLAIEVARGCTRGCRFCQAGVTYRPVRERTPDQIAQLAENGLEASGFDEIALLSLSTGDYSCLETVLPKLMDNYAKDFVSVAMPSMRVGTLTDKIMDQIKRVRKTGFTLAPEAGSERLRRVINKGITEKDLLNTCDQAFELGWRLIKLYFMIGLPTETEEDIEAIAKLVRKCSTDETGRKRKINASIGTFVPKPHTPFQWHKQLTIEESKQKIYSLKDSIPKKVANLKYHDPHQSFLEGVFSRGDRRLSLLILEAWKMGARFDGWSDYFNLRRWQQAAENCDLDLDWYLRARTADEILPWSHLDTGIDSDFLVKEMQKALEEVYTPDCRYNDCQQCGLCDFETIGPVVHQPITEEIKDNTSKHTTSDTSPHELHLKYIISYQRIGKISFLGHLEFLQLIFRAIKRAGITPNFSQGYNPSPKISFGPALPVGTESLAEFFIIDLPSPVKNTQKTIDDLNIKLPPGLRVTAIESHSGKMAESSISTYEIKLPFEAAQESLDAFMTTSTYTVTRVRKGKKKKVDIRPLIKSAQLLEPKVFKLEIITVNGSPSIKPLEVAATIFDQSVETITSATIRKTHWVERKLNTDEKPENEI